MKIGYMMLAIFCVFFFTSSMVIMIPRCKGQQAFPNVTYDEYGWTSDMKKYDMTTQDIGLTFKITIYDNSTEPFDTASVSLYIYINVVNNVVTNGVTQNINVLSKTITFDSTNELYLPAGESSYFFVKVKYDYSDTPLPIGSYTADLSYSNSPLNYGAEGTPMGEYPFNFEVETPQTLQQKINGQATNLSGLFLAFGIIIVLAIVLSVAATFIIATKTNFFNKKNQKFQFFGSLATILGLIFTGITLYLQIIRW